jgi:hypothetical protein
MPFPEQHVGHPVVARIDLAAMHPPDLTVEGMDRLTTCDAGLDRVARVIGIELDQPAQPEPPQPT